jgi:hypothetical protein
MSLRSKEKENRNWEVHTTTTFICAWPCRSSSCRTAPPCRRRASDLGTHGSFEGLGAEEPGRRKRASGLGRWPPGQHMAMPRWVGGVTSSSRLVDDNLLRVHKLGLDRKQGICWERQRGCERWRRRLYVTPEERWRRWSSGSGSRGTCAIVPPLRFPSSDLWFRFCRMLSRGT